MAFLSLFASCAVLFVVFFLAATLLRAATALANRVIGPIKTEAPITWGDWDSDDDDDEILPKGSDAAIPEPGLGRGMLIAFLTLLASLFGGGLSRAILDRPIFNDDVVQLGTLVFGTLSGYLALLALLAGMLPTKPKWAALAALFMFVFLVGLIAFAAGVVYLVLG
ncbi:MAG: hypothetical protein U0792_10365 [Gemmataceae bacterium]